jgi:hypothetical protein
MSVATEFAPVVYIPPAARQPERPLATVTTLFVPSEDTIAPPMRLTRRGVAVLAAAAAVVSALLVWVAWLSAPSASAGGAAGAGSAPASVTVGPGDTLWSIATRVAPNKDPRAEVAALQRINHLAGVDLATGQVLLTR